ncbi:poly-beta-1,6-N-acetyl-D-glucosamine N-deacetylase PgaB [Cognatilysobacter segetis]|uniref:poly-beta-1,6-N-acetyl-D-glucosamine N-deacetylase PgaB n=1 Tax=Cognatilysobacter segetis TaxID=2492394 RepID=UPI00105DC79A|nr:poly-beta-1,6-N-acetyl-D-glucosamine N-deacetylase PgaB [Lysobacter segetis]
MRSLALFLVLLMAALTPRPAAAVVVLGWHDIRDRIPDGDPDADAITARNFAMQLDWLRAHGYVPVTAQALRDARDGRAALPPKAVLLTFDGGYRSAYTHALPLLEAFGYPALVALPTARIDAGAGAMLREGARALPRDAFLTWADVKALQASGLVELASQGHDLVTPVPADPQGDLLPASTTRRWDGGYESDAAYRERLRRDLATSAELIARATGRRPQALVLPGSAGNTAAAALAGSLGMPLVLASDARSGSADARFGGHLSLDAAPANPVRLVMHDNPGASDLAYELRRDVRRDGLRGVHVALDDIVGADAAATGRNVEALAERIRGIHPSHVFLQALTDTNGDGRVDAAYFPTARLPMRSDLFTHVAARLMARAGVDVYAWVPGDGPADASAVYEDLAIAAPISGLVFDDANAGSSNASRALVAAASAWRPGMVTMHAVPASAGDAPGLAARLAALADDDFVAVMLPPGLRANRGDVDRIVANVARVPGALDRTVFVVDAGDATHAVPAAELEAQVRRVIASGGQHVAYSRDNALTDQPPLDPARAAISARAFPYLER